MRRLAGRAARAACAAVAAAVAAACAGGCGSTPVPAFSLTQVTSDFSAMAALKPLVGEGKGSIAVLLPTTTTDRFFNDVVQPEMVEAFQQAGLASDQYEVQLAEGGNQFNQAEKAIRNGARVLILDARSSGDGAGIEAYAHQHDVKVIDYDWLSTDGSADYYVSFDSLKIGLLQGEGLIGCASAWNVKRPRVLVMQGDSSVDYNVPVYVQGAMAVLGRQAPAGWQEVVDPHGTWNTSAALSDFEQEYAADPNIGAVLFANDENGEPIIQYLMARHVKPRTLPTVGLDATTKALQYIAAGYECGTVYKPTYLEVQASVALALYVRAGQPFPGLLGQSVTDEENINPIPSVLLTPEWVTTQNMRATVIADGIRDGSLALSDVCTAQYLTACAAAGISS